MDAQSNPMTLTELLERVEKLDREVKQYPANICKHTSPDIMDMPHWQLEKLGLTALPLLAKLVKEYEGALKKCKQARESTGGNYMWSRLDLMTIANEALAKGEELVKEMK